MTTNTEKHPHTDHPRKLRIEIKSLVDHLRRDVDKVSDPKAQALFETSAEVLTGLAKAFDHYQLHAEAAWRDSTPASPKKKVKPMPQGDKSSYTDKQKRQAAHIEAGYKKSGVSLEASTARAWATVNKLSGGGKMSGSGRRNPKV